MDRICGMAFAILVFFVVLFLAGCEDGTAVPVCYDRDARTTVDKHICEVPHSRRFEWREASFVAAP